MSTGRPPYLRLVLLALATVASCRPMQVAAPWSPPPEEDAGSPFTDAHPAQSTDASLARAASLCDLRVSPPVDLSANPVRNSPFAIAAGRAAWGIVWQESVDGTDSVFFVSVGADGRRRGAPVRVSERGIRGRWPTIFWNGSVWFVMSSGGNDRWDELWLQRIDGQGALLGPPRRVTSRDRHDRWATFAPGPEHGAMLAWSSEIPGENQSIQTLRVGEWGQQLGRPSVIVERVAPLSKLSMVPWRDGYVLCWTSSRRNSFVIEGAQLGANGALVGGVQRLTQQTLGEGEIGPPIALAQSNTELAMSWEQFREGQAEVVFGTIDGRLAVPNPLHSLVLPDGVATSPALIPLPANHWAFAYQRGFAGTDHSVVLTIQSGWSGAIAPNIRLRGNDGTAAAPKLSLLGDRLAVLSSSGRGLSVHTISLANCLNP